MINEYNFYWGKIDLFNYSYYNWKPKLVLALILNFSMLFIISDVIFKTNDWKDFSLLC